MCTFPSTAGTAKIEAKCVDGSLVGADGDALITFGQAGTGKLEVHRFDLKLGTDTTLTENVYVGSRPVVAKGEVYFLNCDTVSPCEFQAVPTSGGPPRTVVQVTDDQLALPLPKINGFVVDASSIYWASNALWSAPLTGGTPTRLADLDGQPTEGGGRYYDESVLSIDETGLYAAYLLSCPTTLERIALDGSSRAMIENGVVGNVAARDGVVYWTVPVASPDNGCAQSGGGGSGGSCGVADGDGALQYWSADAGAQTVEAQIDGRGALVVDKSVAWTVGGVESGCVASSASSIMELVGGMPTTVATAANEGPFYSMVTDGTYLYAETRSYVWRVPFR